MDLGRWIRGCLRLLWRRCDGLVVVVVPGIAAFAGALTVAFAGFAAFGVASDVVGAMDGGVAPCSADLVAEDDEPGQQPGVAAAA